MDCFAQAILELRGTPAYLLILAAGASAAVAVLLVVLAVSIVLGRILARHQIGNWDWWSRRWDRLGEPGLRQARNRAARQGIKWTLGIATLGILIHVVLLALPGIRQSAQALRSTNLWLVALAVLAEFASNAALPQLYRRSLIALGGTIRYRDALPITMGMFTVGHVLPAGGAAAAVWGANRLTRLGVNAGTATTSVVLGGTFGLGTLAVIAFAGAAWSLARGDVSPTYAAGMGTVLLVLAALGVAVWKAFHSRTAREWMLRALATGLHKLRIRPDVASWLEAAESITRAVTRKRRVISIIAWSAINWLTDSAALWLLFLAFGYRIQIGVLLVGYGVANLLVSFPVAPGGLGVVEAGMAGIYTAFGAPGRVAVVAVLCYRLLSFWLPVLAGVPAYLTAGRGSASRTAQPR